jgi:hypothetical protein
MLAHTIATSGKRARRLRASVERRGGRGLDEHGVDRREVAPVAARDADRLVAEALDDELEQRPNVRVRLRDENPAHRVRPSVERAAEPG